MRVRKSHTRYGGVAWSALAASLLVALATIVPGTSAVAAPLPTPGPAVHGSGGEGTIAAKGGQDKRAAVRHAVTSAAADATGALSTVSSVTVNGGYTAAGIGMRNLGYGTIAVTGVPAGATVASATLLWDVLADQSDPTFAQGSFNGTPVDGTNWASGASPCWQPGSNFSYEANVTSLVSGNGSYALAGLRQRGERWSRSLECWHYAPPAGRRHPGDRLQVGVDAGDYHPDRRRGHRDGLRERRSG